MMNCLSKSLCQLSSYSFRPRPSLTPLVPKRYIGIPPAFLLDEYIPRYQLLTSIDAAKKRSLAYAHLRECNLCPRNCGVNRYEKTGVCLIGAETVKVNTIAPHRGEEPCIQGFNGSGSVFFSGCNLRCVFCQNHDIAHQRNGFDLTPEELADWFMKLQEVGNCHNINLVTPEHVVPQVALAILTARDMGLKIPIIYNTSSFDSLESLELLDGLVDIYLPDFKVWKNSTSKRLLKAEDYAETATESIKAMHKQVGDLCFTSDGIAKKGILLRHLVMPGKEDEGRKIMIWLAENVSKDLYVHIMEQYHPDAHVGKRKRTTKNAAGEEQAEVRYAEINRAVRDDELSSVRDAAVAAGLWRFCEANEDNSMFHLNNSPRPPRLLPQIPHPSRPRNSSSNSSRPRPPSLVSALCPPSRLLLRRHKSHEAQLTLSATGSEGGEGQRTHIQVLANSVVATVLILLHTYVLSGSSAECFENGRGAADLLVVGIVANYAAVAADTYSSELGILSKSKPRLITSPTLRVVPPGTNGGVTAAGLLAGVLGAFTVAVASAVLLPFCAESSLMDRVYWTLAFTGWGTLGSVLDSILGGLLQASVVDKRTGKVVEGDGGKKVLVHPHPRAGGDTGYSSASSSASGSVKQRKEEKGGVEMVHESRKVESGMDLLDNNTVNVLMAFIMSVGAMGVAGWVWGVSVFDIAVLG
ncbi:integral membrane protein DUF92-domain-containing protein [Aspergillus bertholletiae]|uniref:Integral membrane protein DUF92-domain-containing protein n=1 Tax=Aspergillus bertholletiae TaxID=1226010 RepID=A0A5N7B375_9EURO|nr:integral membrane protein DUF92-domain-containing protein [Aspergillus bertholletiae]